MPIWRRFPLSFPFTDFSRIFGAYFSAMSTALTVHILNVFLHSCGAVVSHAFRYMAVYVERKSGCCISFRSVRVIVSRICFTPFRVV